MALLTLLFPQAGAAPVNAVVNVGLFPPELDLDAGFHDQYVVFNGTVSIEDTLDRELTVVMQPMITYPLSGALSPDYMVFTRSGSAPFNCTVRVPAKTCNLTSSVFVNAQAHYRTDIVGANQSRPVTVVVGALPAPKPPPADVGIVYGSSSIGMMPVIVLLAALSTALFAWAAARRRRRGRAQAARPFTEDTSGPP